MSQTQTLEEKLAILADAAKYDASCASGGGGKGRKGGGQRLGSTQSMGICHSYTPDGRCVSLLKILLTNFCIFDCQYCINRTSSNVTRARFTPQEVAELTLKFYKRNYIEGLFLSSGIIQSPDHTMAELALAAKLLRTEHAFNGYIHLKAVPGASYEALHEAGRWADRLSANIELPTDMGLQTLAPAKTHKDTEDAMGAINLARDSAKSAGQVNTPAGQSTQMIVGATPDSDQKILTTSSTLYRTYKLRRVYYSAYSPIPDSDARLPSQSPPLLREHRLYQADWLLRFYGFGVDEILESQDANLDLELDPKLAWALRHREFFPVDLNQAPLEALLRVPGLGQRSVERIVRARRHRALRLSDLEKICRTAKKARHFLVVQGSNPYLRDLDAQDLRPKFVGPQQLSLFSAGTSALSGEV